MGKVKPKVKPDDREFSDDEMAFFESDMDREPRQIPETDQERERRLQFLRENSDTES